MTITTKKGDKGKSYWKNVVVDKDDFLLEVVGEIDELSAVIGVVRGKIKEESEKWKVEDLGEMDENEKLKEVQENLQKIAGLIAGYDCKFEKEVLSIEKEIKLLETNVPKFKEFVFFGEDELRSLINLSRTVCRRVERRMVTLSKKKDIDDNLLIYLNRLSDYLFLLSIKK